MMRLTQKFFNISKMGKWFFRFIKSNVNLYNLNIFLIIFALIVLLSHSLLSRGLEEDGSFNLVRLILKERIQLYEISRFFFHIFHQFPSWLFIKLSPSESLSILTIIYSFSLVGVHLLSFLGCYYILPQTKKKLIFFPLFAFWTGPATALGISVSVSLSVFSYIWLTAFVIHYSDLSVRLHKILFFLVPLPLLLAHEMMSYMAWLLVVLCFIKLNSATRLINKFLIKFIICYFTIAGLLQIFFIFTVDKFSTSNFVSFKTSLLNFNFLFSDHSVNLVILTALFLKASLFMQLFSNESPNGKPQGRKLRLSSFLLRRKLLGIKAKEIQNKLQFTLFALLSLIGLIMVFTPFSIYHKFFFIADYYGRVWPPVFSLPLGLLLWWLYERKFFSFERAKIFILPCFISCLSLAVYRLKSDFQFYQHQRQFSKQLEKCQGALNWSVVKDHFSFIEERYKLENNVWKITSVSLIYPRSQNIKAILLNDDCAKNLCSYRDISLDSCSKFCNINAYHLPSVLFDNSLNSRLFNFKPLIENISKGVSVCKE